MPIISFSKLGLCSLFCLLFVLMLCMHAKNQYCYWLIFLIFHLIPTLSLPSKSLIISHEISISKPTLYGSRHDCSPSQDHIAFGTRLRCVFSVCCLFEPRDLCTSLFRLHIDFFLAARILLNRVPRSKNLRSNENL